MRSGALRLSCAAAVWIAIGGAAFLIYHAETQQAVLDAHGRTFDLRARETVSALSDLRAARQAYVAAGQGVAFWMPTVLETSGRVHSSIPWLRAAASSESARAAIDEAAAMLAQFDEVDARAREYLNSGELLMAGDVIFTEGDQLGAAAARNLEMARIEEGRARDAAAATVQRQEALALAGAGSLAAVVVLLLGLSISQKPAEAPISIAHAIPNSADRTTPQPRTVAAPAPTRPVSPVLRTAAQLCTDFACVQDINDLRLMLARTCDTIDAEGLVVWLRDSEGAQLQPVLTHGYSEDALARLPSVPRTADNAAAAAYRSGDLQIVPSRPGGTRGAIVAPIIAAQGCIGALSAEIRGGGEASESVLALATIVAAQLAGVLAEAPGQNRTERIAASS